MRAFCRALIAAGTCIVLSGCQEVALDKFVAMHTEKIAPLNKEAALAWWDAATTGADEHYQRSADLQLQIRTVYSDRRDFEYIRRLKEAGGIRDPLLARQVTVLYNAYLGNQIDRESLAEMVELSTQIEQNFSTHRGTMDGRKATDNEIKDVLKTETNSTIRKKAWLASKEVGEAIAGDLLRLVKMRNVAARKLGFENFHTMRLTTGEQDVEALDRVFAELEELTNKPFAELKEQLDQRLAKIYGIDVDQLRPWHYHDPFFQETPMVYELDLDQYYRGKVVRVLAAKFFSSIGLPVESVLLKSDLYERDGKNPHAFCTDIDREGDVRILCNIQNNETWMEVTLHELGHAVYNKYQDPQVPYLLREPAHAFTTEGIAMFFGRLSRNPAWMQKMLGLGNDQRAEIEKVGFKYAQLKQLIFARWAMVMYNFEKALYADPDQDLNSLWWEMVAQYQMVRSPEGRDKPDWAAKIHFAVAPCYYHNYMLGELFASQLHHRLVKDVLGASSDVGVSYVGQVAAGKYIEQYVLRVGSLYHWDEMIERATGEPLTAKYFAQEFVR